MLSLLMVLLDMAGSVPEKSGRADVFATVGHSEWCPAGNVQLDLRTGDYRYTPRASRRVCGNAKLDRPVRTGRLGGRDLADVRSAFERVQAEGVVDPACTERAGQRPLVISNGGTVVLVLTNGARTLSAPEDLGCWSDAAKATREVLEREFSETRD